jgi:hypothetical protein
MSKDTFWAIRRRELAKHGAPVAVVEEVIEEPEPEVSDADVVVEKEVEVIEEVEEIEIKDEVKKPRKRKAKSA